MSDEVTLGWVFTRTRKRDKDWPRCVACGGDAAFRLHLYSNTTPVARAAMCRDCRTTLIERKH